MVDVSRLAAYSYQMWIETWADLDLKGWIIIKAWIISK